MKIHNLFIAGLITFFGLLPILSIADDETITNEDGTTATIYHESKTVITQGPVDTSFETQNGIDNNRLRTGDTQETGVEPGDKMTIAPSTLEDSENED